MVSKNSTFTKTKADADTIIYTFMCNQFFRKIWDSPVDDCHSQAKTIMLNLYEQTCLPDV